VSWAAGKLGREKDLGRRKRKGRRREVGLRGRGELGRGLEKRKKEGKRVWGGFSFKLFFKPLFFFKKSF
jgi:hypothetical protein